MTSIRKSRLAVRLGLAVLGMLALGALVFGLEFGTGPHARAAVVSGLNFSIGVGSQCDSSSGSSTCSISPSASFTVAFKINALGSTPDYGGYDVDILYSGDVTYTTGSLKQTVAQDPGLWPGCVFSTGEAVFVPGNNSTACSIGAGAPSSTYTGAMATMGFACGASGSGTITLVQGDAITDLVDATSFASSSEADPPAVETLTINCGAGGGPTNTPTGPTSTPGGPTNTPAPTHAPTPTRTPAAKACGDVNDNGAVNSVDALLILQLGANLITSLLNAPSADVNHNGTVNAVDASLILQKDAGLIQSSVLRCS